MKKDFIESNKDINFMQRIFKIFSDPKEVFNNIKEKPKILFPFIYVFVITVVISILQKPMIELQEKRLQDLYIERYGFDVASLSQKGIGQLGLGGSGSIILTIGGILVGLWISWLISSGFLFIISKILRGEANYRQLLSLEIHLGILTSTLILITTPIDLFLKNPVTVFSLSVFYPKGDLTSITYNILNAITLFSLWALILRGMGLHILNNFSKKKAYLTVVFLYVINIMFSVGSVMISLFMFDILYKGLNI